MQRPCKLSLRSFWLISGPGSAFWQHPGLVKRLNEFIYILSDIRSRGQLGSEGQPVGPHLPGHSSRREECTAQAQEHQIHFVKPCPVTKAPAQLQGACPGPRQRRPAWWLWSAAAGKGAGWPQQRGELPAPPRNPASSFLTHIRGLWLPLTRKNQHGLKCPSMGRFTFYLQKWVLNSSNKTLF